MENKTNKQKLIEHLYQFTSKELSFGCEVVVRFNNDTFSKQTLIKKKKFENHGHSPRYRGNRHYYLWSLKDNSYKPEESDIVEILGHPPQWHHLLLALGRVPIFLLPDGRLRHEGLNSDGDEDLYTVCTLDLTTNLKDMPEDTAEKLCQLLNIG